MTELQRLEAGRLPLLTWYHENARTLPWRTHPDPYRVWISEIMLQQTRVSAVLDYYARFMAELPDVYALAHCPEERLLKLWQGLGYYSRAKNLQKAAKIICDQWQGQFPPTRAELEKLPGIGDYTAGAIASIAFGQPEPAVDGNVLRVVTRLLADQGDITTPGEKRRIRTLLSRILPPVGAGELNQALMELGALVCLPNGTPKCQLCPWHTLCLSRELALTAQIPVKAPKRPRRREDRRVFLIVHQNRVALRQRPEKGLLASLWEFPNEPGSVLPLDDWGIVPLSLVEGESATHIFTHIQWNMTGVEIAAATSHLPDGWVWADGEQLQGQYPVPSAFGVYLSRALTLCRGEERHAL